MENIADKLNLVIDYIEEHLTDDIDQDMIAQIACCSYYDVGRIFSLIAGVNIAEYVRKRRLTLAGNELKYLGARVIDVALKYGYESPISFARAFQSFHGVNPSLVSREESVLNAFPRLIYQICVKEVMSVIKKDIIEIDGKEYEASYFGEADMSSWSVMYTKRKYWRIENAYDDMKDKRKLDSVLPYNNYPPINIEIGQIFAIDYYQSDDTVDRKYYIADGTVWENMPCTCEFIVEYMNPIRSDELLICGRKYKADYFGEQDISEWSVFSKREFWRLEGIDSFFEKFEATNNVLPYNNYPPINIEKGQIFVVDYHSNDGSVSRVYYLADGTVWQDMPSTREIILSE